MQNNHSGNGIRIPFNEHEVLHELKHYLPSQAPLKDFIHHNTLHAFQQHKFHEALRIASATFGYKVYLRLDEYRSLYHAKKIRKNILEKTIVDAKGAPQLSEWMDKLLNKTYDTSLSARIGQLRQYWKNTYSFNMDKEVHPLLFRLVGSYLDQGVSIWNFPVSDKGFLASIKEMERNSFVGLFKSKRAKNLLFQQSSITGLLDIIVGEPALYERYLFDQQFAHPGWSGMASVLESQPESLLDRRCISLNDFIMLELLLEIDALDNKFGENWSPLANRIDRKFGALFAQVPHTELDEVLTLWQDAFEWNYYDQVLTGLKTNGGFTPEGGEKTFQAMFCIDDRECSLRRYIEAADPNCSTYGTPGFFGVEFYFQPEHGKFYTKVCPAPVNPKYLIRELESQNRHRTDNHFTKHTHGLLGGWLISQTLGFWSAFRLMLNVFKPSKSPAMVSSFAHMDKYGKLTIENTDLSHVENGLQIGFTIAEMADRVEGQLKSIGLVDRFAPLVYVIGHGASSINNTHYAGYDCGACSGRPGSVNARVISFMANHPKVRELLRTRGVDIPVSTQFVGGLHDTTRDEIEFYAEGILSPANRERHDKNVQLLAVALDNNAKERARRFVLTNNHAAAKRIHKRVKLRSVSLFEPRPELNHATNALCIIGRRDLTKHLFLDRRSFMNSYDYRVDPEGKYLFNILNAAAPVCGGINLEYYFSRVDNYKLGAGSKLPHNVMGLIGVANGMDGDLRSGLPSQMIEVHDPVRLLMVVEQTPELLLNVIKQSDATYEWFINEWVHLIAIHPETKEQYHFSQGAFVPYRPTLPYLERIEDTLALVETSEDNFPVYQISLIHSHGH